MLNRAGNISQIQRKKEKRKKIRVESGKHKGSGYFIESCGDGGSH